MTAQQKKFDVGIVGWWYGKNYGSILTYYGLNQAIQEIGCSVLMIHETLGYNSYRVKWPEHIVSMEFARRVGYSYSPQLHFTELSNLNNKVNAFIVGSDQLWNPLIGRVNDDLFLDFVAPENRRIAYATSFGNRGTTKFKPEFVEKNSANLQKFDAISVRESYAVNTAKTIFGVTAQQVVDPVFLLPRARYEKLAQSADLTLSGEYLVVFFLDPSLEKREIAIAIADKLGLRSIVVIPNPDDGRPTATTILSGDRFKILPHDSPEIFLQAYIRSRYVVTDSFHGTAFAVIFNKPFSSIYNTRRGADRFKDLMSFVGIGESRRVLDTDSRDKIQANPNVTLELDFKDADARIANGRQASLDWLRDALDGQVQRARKPRELSVTTVPMVASKEKAADVVNEGHIIRPLFQTNNPAWRIVSLKNTTDLRLAPRSAVRGILVWCDLPYELIKNAPYRLTIIWKLRTTARSVNLHIRNPMNGKFHVIGTILTGSNVSRTRTDTIDFIAPEDGYSQFMLGAVHFLGANGGTEVENIVIHKTLNIGEKRPNSLAAYADKVKEPVGPIQLQGLPINHLDAVIESLKGRVMRLAHSYYLRGLKEKVATPFRMMISRLSDLTTPKSKAVRPIFASNNDSWQVKPESAKTILTVSKGAGERGNLVWCNLPYTLAKGRSYRIQFDWSLTTEDDVVTVNIRNGETGHYQPAAHVAIGNKRDSRRVDFIDCTAKTDGLNQIMIGSSQFKGAKPGIIIYGIEVLKGKADYPVTELAVPAVTRNIQKVVEEILGDKRVGDWRAEILSVDKEIELYVAKLLKDLTWNKVGGPADLIAFPRSVSQVSQLLNVARENQIPVTILGLCSNILVRDGGIRGLVISMSHLTSSRLEGDKLVVEAGAGLTDTAFYLLEHGKSGLEWAAGIPGTIGGAIYMNAGTNISDIRRSIDSITVFDHYGNVRTLNTSEISWGKRYSTFQEKKNWVILEATFRTADGDVESMQKEMNSTIDKRASHFPLNFPNHGSTFKWWRAPRLISQSGLVGYQIGGVQVSTKQHGFFVNLGDATASDYEALINYAIAKVYERSGFLMEPEVEIIGERLHRYERYTVAQPMDNPEKLDMR